MSKFLSVFLLCVNISVLSLEYKNNPEDLVKALLLERKYSIEEVSKESGVAHDKVKIIKNELEQNKLSLKDKHLAALALLGKNNKFSRAIAKDIISTIENSKNKDLKLLADVYHTLGSTFFTERKMTKALKYFELSLKYKPKNIELLMNSGRIYEHFGRFNDAILTYKKALRLEPDNEKVKFYLKDLQDYLKANPDAEDLSKSLKNKKKSDGK